MKETTKIALKKELHSIKWTNFIFLTLSGLVNATGVTLFLTPVNLVDGGFSGTSFVISALSNGYITLSLALVVLNFPFFIFGAKKLGLQFVIYSLYAIAMYSLFAYLYQHVLPIDFTNGAPLTGSDLLLASIFGGLISGMGSGLTIRFGGALDGVEVMAVVFSKKLNLTVGTFVMGYNLILFTITGIVFSAWTLPLYSILAYAVGLKAVDYIVEGVDKAKSVMIITQHEEQVLQKISDYFGRGITIFDAHGYYSREKKSVIYVVVNRFQISKLKSLIHAVDTNAFVTITDISETLIGSSNKLPQSPTHSGKLRRVHINKSAVAKTSDPTPTANTQPCDVEERL